MGGVKFPQGEESVVIHCKINYRLYKEATCHNICPCDFTDVTAFSLFFLALHYCFYLYIFFLLWLFFGFFIYFFNQVLFHGCIVLFQGHLSPWSFAFSGCFFGLFCAVLLGSCFLALHRVLALQSLLIGTSYGIL